MGVFSRFRDIVSSNINAMLEKAEDPEKLIKLMIQEMEETLVELKASCAASMAARTRARKGNEALAEQVTEWSRRAKLAVDRGRDELAREAIAQRQALEVEQSARAEAAAEVDALIARYQKEIEQLEEKLVNARAKYKALLEREKLAHQRKRSQTGIRTVETSDAFTRFEHVENRVNRLEHEADLVRPKRDASLEDKFRELEHDDSVEAELESLKAGRTRASN